jgi:hypothetical protein
MLWLLRGLGVRKPQSSTCRNAGLLLSWVFSASWRLSSSQILGHICRGALCGARLHLWANYTTPVPFTWYDVCVNPALKFSSGLVFCWSLFPSAIRKHVNEDLTGSGKPGHYICGQVAATNFKFFFFRSQMVECRFLDSCVCWHTGMQHLLVWMWSTQEAGRL